MLLTQMWNEEEREARGLRRMSVTVSSPADERKGRDWFHAGLVCRRAAIDAGSVRCSAAVAEQAVPAAHVGLFDSLKNFAADNLGNVLGGDFNLGSIGDLPAVIGEHFNADQLGAGGGKHLRRPDQSGRWRNSGAGCQSGPRIHCRTSRTAR